MTSLFSLLLGVAITLILLAMRTRFASFRAQRPAEYAALSPAFDPRTHLSGPMLCEGVIYGPTGRITSRFVADMVGEWEGNVGTLRETFRYDSGTVQERAWTLRLGNDGRIEATAADVPGTGEGWVDGAGVLMRYRIRLTPESGGHVLDVTDWMVLMENGTIINRSQFTKFGVQVAELVATMRRVPA
jgi:hypothetical protein